MAAFRINKIKTENAKTLKWVDCRNPCQINNNAESDRSELGSECHIYYTYECVGTYINRERVIRSGVFHRIGHKKKTTHYFNEMLREYKQKKITYTGELKKINRIHDENEL